MNGIVSIPESVQNKLQNVMLVRQQELAKPKDESKSWFGSDNKEEQPSTSWFSSDKKEEQPSTSWFGSDNKEEQPSTSWFGSDNKEEKKPSTTAPSVFSAPIQASVPVVPMEKNTNCDIRGWSK
jgi:hypothetical protein